MGPVILFPKRGVVLKVLALPPNKIPVGFPFPKREPGVVLKRELFENRFVPLFVENRPPLVFEKRPPLVGGTTLAGSFEALSRVGALLVKRDEFGFESILLNSPTP
jgi:hypothetical protein